MDWTTTLQVVQTVGLPVVLCLFFVWQNKINSENSRAEWLEREKRLAHRIQALEDFERTTLVTLVKEGHACVKQNTDTWNRFEKILERSDIRLGSNHP